jgi:glycosyltransferase involved in cell wall biosynthesis
VADLAHHDRKVNVLIAVSGLGIGGAEVVIQHLAYGIDRRSFNVGVCCIRVRGPIGEELARAGIDIVTLSNASVPKPDYFAFIKLLKVIREKNIDVLHTHTVNALVAGGLCKLLMPRLKLIHTFHFGNYPHLGNRIMWMEHLFSRLATRLIAVGEVQRQQLKSTYRFGEQSVGMVWNGVPLNSHAGDPAFRSRVGADQHVLVGTIATLIEQKGLRDFLAVARRFQSAADKVRFVIVGEGHLRAELETMRRDWGLENTLVITGWVPNAASVALPCFDVFFQPSLWEAMSIAILEAMAAGKPIVATRVGETPHIIEDGVDGLLVNPKDVDGMADAVGRLVDDADLRRQLGAAAQHKVGQRFTVEQMTRTYEDIYLQTVEPTGRKPSGLYNWDWPRL